MIYGGTIRKGHSTLLDRTVNISDVSLILLSNLASPPPIPPFLVLVLLCRRKEAFQTFLDE